jgi:hypothetical protein
MVRAGTSETKRSMTMGASYGQGLFSGSSNEDAYDSFGAHPVPRRLHGHEDRFGAAGGHRAARVVVAVEQVVHNGDGLALHLAQAGEDERVERVLEQRVAPRRLEQRVDLRACVVDQGPGAGVVVIGVLAPAWRGAAP